MESTYRSTKDRPIDHERQVRHFYKRFKNERFVICRSYISSRKDHAFREDIYEDTQAIAHEASIKGWTRLLNDQ